MTKPNEFTLNTDYIPLAQFAKKEITAFFPAQFVPGGQSINWTQDFQVPAVEGAVDRILISLDNSVYTIGSSLAIRPYSATGVSGYSFYIFRPNATTIRVRVHGYTSSPDGMSFPNTTLKAKISSFKPPNVF